ncbi:hypothetical protein RHSIM_Rhsim07G0175200 [Rhododendron simsii]|uniref:BED-type domain-containing protein n=1 Tax=Rhododendron simsii TaxID=118357 RepID=A0A834GNW1_RHOSS|nr:hypothetical protein RHSIM_Rhsim07G0175200 [Rhododendron simsii]
MSQSQNVSSTASNTASDNSTALKRASNDMGWEYGILVDPTNLDKIQCKLCGKIMSSGISRLKKHIAQIKGSVSSCPNASKEDIAKCKAAVEEGSKKKKDKLQAAKEIREEVTIMEEEDGDEEVEIVGTRKRPHTLGPMDKHVSDINPGKKMMGQQTISGTLLKARSEKVDSFLARWVYEASIPFHAIDNNSFAQFCEALTKFKGVIEKAKAFTIFIYAHHTTLALMRKATKKRDIVRPGVTRFAASFLTLQSLAEKKEALKVMVTSNEWGQSKWGPSSTKGKIPYATVLSISFWNGVSLCLKVFAPLVKVLRLVDGDRPSMGFVYGELQKAKQEIIEVCKSKEALYKPILDIIDKKSQGRLDSPLHLTAYLLNPFYFYKDQTIQNDSSIMEAVVECVERFYPEDVDAQDYVINKELLMYKNKVGMFGKIVAVKRCEANNDNYDPVYVQFNTKLINKKARKKETDVLLASEATHAQGWIVEGGDDDEVEPGSGLTYELLATTMGVDEVFMPRSGRNVGVREPRELHEEDFVSEEDSEEENEEIDFESNEDQVLEGYGGEEIEEGNEL